MAYSHIRTHKIHVPASAPSKRKTTADIVCNGFAITGIVGDGCKIKIEIDGSVAEEEYTVSKTSNRECSYYKYGLSDENHTVKITVLEGKYAIDAVEVSAADISDTNDIPEQTSSQESTTPESDTPDSVPDESSTTESNTTGSNTTESGSTDSGDNGIILPVVIGAGAVISAAAAVGTVIAVKNKKKNK